MKKILTVLTLTLGLTLGTPQAQAMSKNTQDVLVITGYGLGVGAALGLLTWPVSGRATSVLVGAGVGVILGFAIGIYHIENRKNPENPLIGNLRYERDPHLQAKLSEAFQSPDVAFSMNF